MSLTSASRPAPSLAGRQRSAGRPYTAPRYPWSGDRAATEIGVATAAPVVGGRAASAIAAVTAAPVVGGRAAAAIAAANAAPINWEGRRASVFVGACGARTYSYGGPSEGGSANFFRGGVCASAIPGYMGAMRAASARASARARAGEAGQGQARPGDAGEAGFRVAEYLGVREGRSAERWHGVKHSAGRDGDVGAGRTRWRGVRPRGDCRGGPAPDHRGGSGHPDFRGGPAPRPRVSEGRIWASGRALARC